MKDADVQEILDGLARNTHDLARQIKSPKLDLQGMKHVSKALRVNAETFKIVRETMMMRVE